MAGCRVAGCSRLSAPWATRGKGDSGGGRGPVEGNLRVLWATGAPAATGLPRPLVPLRLLLQRRRPMPGGRRAGRLMLDPEEEEDGPEEDEARV